MYLFAGNEDKLATPEDVHAFIDALVNCPKISIKFYEAGHCTYMWGKILTYMDDLLAIIQWTINSNNITISLNFQIIFFMKRFSLNFFIYYTHMIGHTLGEDKCQKS